MARGSLAWLIAVTVGASSAFGQTPSSPASGRRADESWSFNPLGVKRDPFAPPELPKKDTLNELRRYDLNEINLVAILTGLGAPQAMVVLPNGRTHIIQSGDAIGRHNGRVHKITSSEVVVEESFKDFKGRDKRSFTNLVLAQ